MNEKATTKVPTKLLHYDILEVLGEGGNGTVYRAINTKNTDVVALKTLKDVSEVTLTRFKREYMALKRLDNPGIVKVFDAHFEYDPPFFSMEWVRGKTLSSYIQDMENNPMIFTVEDRENFAIRVGIQVCDILSYIHSFNEVHRDLKPDNLFVTMQEEGDIQSDFKIKMLDFGLLKDVSETKQKEADDTQGGMIVGTVHYLSPEQAKGTNLDPRADLYSLGVIIYKLLSLRLPFESEDVVGYLFKTVFEEPIPIEQAESGCSEKMKVLLNDLLSKEPSKRPPSASALKRRLKGINNEDTSLSDIDADDLNFEITIEGFGSPLLPPPMTGRDELLHGMEQVFENTNEKYPQVIVLRGEVGMGRTSLLKEWLARVRFMKGSFMQLQFSNELIPTQDPVGLLLDSLIRGMKPSAIKDVFREVYPFLTAISKYLPKYFDTKGVGRFDHLSPSRRLQVLAVNVIKVIQKLSIKGPVVMLLDDLQHAPDRFLGWMHLFWEQLGTRKLLLVVSCDKIQGHNPNFTSLMKRLMALPETHDVTLGPLNETQVLELLQHMLPIGRDLPFSEKLQKFLFEQAAGNPFYTIELFSRLYEEKQVFLNQNILDIKNLNEIDIPRSIHEVMLKKVRSLSPDTSHMLETAAVLGPSFKYEWLVDALSWADERFLNNFIVLVKLGILTEEEQPVHKVFFNAQSLQKTVGESIPARSKVSYHQRIAQAIESKLEHDDMYALEQVADHYGHGANYVRAIKYAYLAGNAALRNKDIDNAIKFYEFSCKLMDRMENKQARNLINLKLAEVHLTNMNTDKALFYYNQSLERESLSKIEELRSYRGRMLCYKQAGQMEKALEDADALCRLGQSYSSRIRAESLHARGYFSWLARGDSKRYVEDLVEARNAYPKLRHWQIKENFALIMSNQTLEAVKNLRDLIKAEFQPNFELYLQMAMCFYFRGDFQKAMDYLNAGQRKNPDIKDDNGPQLMVAHALMTYKVKRLLAPDHPSEEYISIARRYIERFGLDHMNFYIHLVKLELFLMSNQSRSAWDLVQHLYKEGLPLPTSYLEKAVFLSFVVRAAWDCQEPPPREWLIAFQEIKVQPDGPFLLTTHYALAKAAEALLPMATSTKDGLNALKAAESQLLKQKLTYYYHAILIKQIAIYQKLGLEEQVKQRNELLAKLNGMLGFEK